MRPADELVAVDVGIPAQFLHPLFGRLEHHVLASDREGPRGAGQHAGRLPACLKPCVAEVALGDPVLRPVVPGDLEGAGRDTVLAADTEVLFQPDGAEFRVEESPRRADLHAGRIGAVHAAVLAEEPFEIPLRVHVFLEADERPGVPLQVGGVLVAPEVAGPLPRHFVPLLARDLAAAAGRASRRIDQLYDFRSLHSLSPIASSR
ncbi:MAG: hypothetical protein A4E67_00723 [Syntrophaceae bacterium PtaB.Bin038]|nr:MAG: hypothetical protein A4E67_00723 [Syntrophaceae bacterium PtaB.Bin038]